MNLNGFLPVVRFFAKVNTQGPRIIDTPCWEWVGAKNEYGYGQFWINDKHDRAHVWSYEMNYGPVPDGLLVMHKCDNPPCVNPLHLSTGTNLDNAREIRKELPQFSVKKFDSCDNFFPSRPTHTPCYCGGYHCVGDCDPQDA